MSKLKVLVVGASIAGPTAAYWFAKAGASVTVIERFPKLRTNGQNVDIRTAGVTVMRKMTGMEAAVRAKLIPIEGFSVARSNGGSYGTIRATGNPDQQSLVSEYEIFRGDLAQVLFDLTKDNENIKYVFGEQVASIQKNELDDGPVSVEFMNGSPTDEYDLVVACDGATSRTRAIGLGCGVRDHIQPINCWAAFFSIKQGILKGSKMGHAYSAVGGRFIAVGPEISGVSNITVMGIHPRGDRDATLPFREAMKQGEDALKRFVAQHYKGAGWKTDEVMQDILESEDFYANEIVQVKVPALSKGRFVLVGDAGYAPGPTGGGTSLAIAGAYVLAGEIGKHKGDLAAGLKGYEETMRPIITNLQKIPPFVPGIFAPQTAWGIWLRNNIFAFIAWSRILEFAQKFSGNAFASTEKFPLPDYEWVA
jgi:2-polyprenyl-6-methoxyphenol hydroxylase-like FAD-dependent oxidoreductase